MTDDVVVIGAGPAGSAAATVLARGGATVTLVDKATFPRTKCCGDGLTASALRELEALGLSPGGLETWQPIDSFELHDPRGRRRTFPLPSVGQYAAVAERAELDTALVARAVSAGVRLKEGTTWQDIVATSAGVEVVLNGGTTLSARWLVAADGAWSPTRRHLGLADPAYRGDWHAFRQYFSGVGPEADRLHVFFEPDLLPGYAWSFPLPGGRANIGFGILRDHGTRVQDMAGIWRGLLARPTIARIVGSGAEPEGRHQAWPIPARLGAVPLVGPSTLFAGDAAAVTDPMTGEGIGQALQTGRLAAEAILDTGATTSPTATYGAAVRSELGADHTLARWLSRVLRSPAAASAAIATAGASGWTRRNFARWLFEDYPRAALADPRQWSAVAHSDGGAWSPPESRSRE